MPIKYNRLRVVLAEKELAIGELAVMLEVHRNSVSAWVTNKAQPSLATLYRIAEVLKVDVCDLLVSEQPKGGESSE
jgi:transcriptional regulator with XRE-family HTH domain